MAFNLLIHILKHARETRPACVRCGFLQESISLVSEVEVGTVEEAKE